MKLKVVFFILGEVFVVLAFATQPMSKQFPTEPNQGFAASAGMCMVAAAIANLAEKMAKPK